MNFDQASQDAQTRGAAQTADYTNKANTAGTDYSNYQNQANAANQNIQNQNAYMQGAGSANNLYNNALDAQSIKTGYNQANMQSAQNNLAQAQGSQSAFNDFANTGASKWGLNAGGLAAANAGATQGLSNNVQSAGTAMGIQQKAFEQAQTGANQQTGLNVQQQAQQLQGYKNAFDSAYQQQQQAQSTMLAYQKMAQDQGGLTAQQVQGYQNAKSLSAASVACLASASASMANARNLNQQTDFAQNVHDKAIQDALNASKVSSLPGGSAPGTNTQSGDYANYSYQTPADMASQQSGENQDNFLNTMGNVSRGIGKFAQNPLAYLFGGQR